MSFDKKITEEVIVSMGTLQLGGEAVERFEIRGILGRGVNGVVFDAYHRVLKQPRAVKVWLKLKKNDRRNKVIQGIAEAQKLAAADPQWVVIIYDADTAGGYLFSSMEKIYGRTLKAELAALPPNGGLLPRWHLAQQYVGAIQGTTTEIDRHGDAHSKNVMIYEEKVDYQVLKKMKLLDFGTSMFSDAESSRARHWRIVHETFMEIVRPFKSLNWAIEQQKPYGTMEEVLKCAYFRDVLDGLTIEVGFHDNVLGVADRHIP